jgi:AraC-like DNA-binding protein
MRIAVKILVLLSFLFSKTILAENILAPNNSINLSENILIFQGPQVPNNCQEILPLAKQKEYWHKNQSRSLKTKMNQKQIWISFEIINSFDQELIYFLPFFTGRFSELVLCEEENGKWIETATGDYIPSEKKIIDSNFPDFQLLIPRHSSNTYFLKFISNSQINTSLTIYPLNLFLNLSNTHNSLSIILFLFYGIIIILLSLRFFQFPKSSTMILIFFSLSVLTFSLHEINYFSILTIFHSKTFEIPNSLFFITSFMLIMGYSSYYFEDDDFPSKLPNLIRILVGAVFLIYGVSLLGKMPIPGVNLYSFLAIFIYFTLIYTSYSFVKQDYPPAELYFYGLVLIIFPGFLYILYALQVLPGGFPSYLFILTIPFYIIFLSFPILINKGNNKKLESDLIPLDEIEQNIKINQKPIYKKSHILGINVEKKINELKMLMEVDKVFLDEDLHSGDLAGMLSLTPHQLSQLLSQVLETHYHKMIQEYRIHEAIEKIKLHQDKNLLTIGFEVGFQSKSAFNTAFKKITGQTPMEVKKSFITK